MTLAPLIAPAALRALPDALLLDWRFDLADPEAGRRAYAQGHLPGAHYVHLDADGCGPQRDAQGMFRGRHPLPDRQAFADRMAALGLRPGRPVVCYDAGTSMFAARGWWMLQWIGHAEVAVLDGGLAAWTAAGGALTPEVPAPELERGGPVLAEPRVRTIEAEALAAPLGGRRLVDARAPERFRGEVEPLDTVAGHIPGARNRPFAENLQPNGCFKPAEQLRREWAALSPTVDTVHQCGSGVTACHNLLALAAAGLPVGLLYPGSWSEWCADPRRPVARGGGERRV